MQVEDISFSELEIRVLDKGGKARDIPILESLANELCLHLGDQQTGYVFPILARKPCSLQEAILKAN